ncbi:nucleotide-binding protein [Myxococcus faecalis]|uniref:TIR domain-containing protein n=1 Tax=Myxococcus faecalis TaxID=3115646 RepID=UPI003CED94E9
MDASIEQQVAVILRVLASSGRGDSGGTRLGRGWLDAQSLALQSGVNAEDLGGIIEELEDRGLVEVVRYLGMSSKLGFSQASLTAQGRMASRRLAGGMMSTIQKDPRNVFVVHGRNAVARDALFDFLRSVGLNPMEWEEARRQTGSASPYIGQILDAAFGAAQAIVVLLTGEDEARLREPFRGHTELPHETNLTPQARANVLFEAGMALGRHPERTVLIEIGELRPFSDIAGRHTVRIASGGAGERHAIVERLRDSGCSVVTEGRRDWLERDYFGPVFRKDPK